MNFGEILKKAWNVSWKNKLLWLFAFFGPLAGTASMNFNSSSYNYSESDLPNHNFEFFSEPTTWVFILGMIAVILLIIVISVVLNLYGTTGVILGTSGVIEEDKKPKFKELIKESHPHVLKLLLLKFVIFLLGVAAVILFVIGTIFTLGLLACLAILLIPVFYLLNILISFVYIAMVKDGLDMGAAFSRGWELFVDNFANNVIWALIMGIGQFVINIILGVVMVVLAGLLTGSIIGIANDAGAWLIVLMILIGIFTLAYVVFLFLASALMSSFTWSVMILIYNEYAMLKEEAVLIDDGSFEKVSVEEALEEELETMLEEAKEDEPAESDETQEKE